MNAIIFGAGGQDGYYLSRLLEGQGIYVADVARTSGAHKGNVADYTYVSELIRISQPDYIFHLAANSSTSHEVLFENHETISTGTLNILESARLQSPNSRIFIAGSGMQFQNVGHPINENTPFDAGSSYAVARIQSVSAARYFRCRFGMPVYCGYLFNHDSPMRAEKHVSQMIVSAVKRIAKGSTEKLELGDLLVEKEFGYAGDIVEAMWMLVNQDRIFEVVIGTGIAHSIEAWVDICFRSVGRDWRAHVIAKEGFKAEYRRLVSDNTLLMSLGWRPKVDIFKLSEMMLDL
jgi:GDPmannose 4,6-dehydratase